MGICYSYSKSEEKEESYDITNKNKEEQLEKEPLSLHDKNYINCDEIKIIEKKKENNICKIINANKAIGIGFLCLIPYPEKEKQIPTLITCNHIIKGDEKEVKLIFNEKTEKILKLEKRKIYISNEEDKDIIIIEIKEEDNFDKSNMLEVDYDIFEEKDLNEIFKSIYIIHFPFGNKLGFSKNLIININKKDEIIKHECQTDSITSGAPIMNIKNFKVIGVHRETNREFSLNIGTLLRESIINFNKIQNDTSKEILYFEYGRYEGEIKNGEAEGKGILYLNNSDRYEGNFKNDKFEGKGIYYFNEGPYKGDRYEGDFKKDKFDGKGIYYYNNEPCKGDIYEGDWKNDMKEGKGIYYYNSGAKYEGDFMKDEIEGKGIYYYKNGDRYDGEWKNNKFEGKGTYYYQNGDRYEGDFKNDMKEGKGIYYFENGDKDEGNWKNDSLLKN